MNIPLCFFISLTIAIIGLSAATINMVLSVKHFTIDDKAEFTRTLKYHLIAGAFYVIGGVGAVCFGIAWIVISLKH
jgi:hypothetical protein